MARESADIAEERTCNDRAALFRQRGELFRALTARGYQLQVRVAAPRCRSTARCPPEHSHPRALHSRPRPQPGGGGAERPPPCGPEAARQRQVPARRGWASAEGSLPQRCLAKRRDRAGGRARCRCSPPGRQRRAGRQEALGGVPAPLSDALGAGERRGYETRRGPCGAEGLRGAGGAAMPGGGRAPT